MTKHIVLIMGYPAAGKSTLVNAYTSKGYTNYNRDTLGGSSEKLFNLLEEDIKTGKTTLAVIDNLFPTIESRKLAVDLAKKYKFQITCTWLTTSIEQAQVNVVRRMIQRNGKMLSPIEIKASKDSNMFPPAVLFKYKKEFQKPTLKEGFDYVIEKEFDAIPLGSEYKNKALILDYDGTLRETISGAKFPTDPSDIRILPKRKELLYAFQSMGYILLGVSNQSGIAKGQLTDEMAKACFEKTNELLGFDIPVSYCPHSIPPITCYCRKPMPGLGIELIEKYKLDPSQCIMVGDMTSDKTFAARAGFLFEDQEKFFSRNLVFHKIK